MPQPHRLPLRCVALQAGSSTAVASAPRCPPPPSARCLHGQPASQLACRHPTAAAAQGAWPILVAHGTAHAGGHPPTAAPSHLHPALALLSQLFSPFVLPPVARSQGIKVKSLPVVEVDGLVWVWPGSEEAHAAAGPPPSTLTAPPSGFQVGPLPAPHHGWFLISSRKMYMPAALASLNSHWGWLSARQLSRSSSTRPLAPPAGCTVSLSSLAPSVTLSTLRFCPGAAQVHAELVLEVPVEHGLLLENLLDLAHAPFTHTTTFAKGWPVPGAPAPPPLPPASRFNDSACSCEVPNVHVCA